MIRKIYLSLITFGVTVSGYAEVINQHHITASPDVKSVYWSDNSHMPLSVAIGDLNLNDPLWLNFDILENENPQFLRASVEHRDALWQKENIASPQYIEGFNISDIGYGTPSIGGITTLYRNYRWHYPLRNFRLKLPGNYILSIFPDSNPDSVILSVPFSLQENNAAISATVSPVTDIDYLNSNQQLEINVDISNLPQSVQPNDITVLVSQNNTPGMERVLAHPSSIKGRSLTYSHLPGLIFPASNEYRRMEVISNEIPSLHVDRIEWHDPLYHQILTTDQPKIDDPYTTDFSNHGSFMIREYNAVDHDLEADYCVVHFSLDGSTLPAGSKIFLEGDFTGRTLDKDNIMKWDSTENIYYKSLLLKNGAYSYKYISPDMESVYAVDGNKYPTNNRYYIKVYYRIPGERFDRLATSTFIDSTF